MVDYEAGREQRERENATRAGQFDPRWTAVALPGLALALLGAAAYSFSQLGGDAAAAAAAAAPAGPVWVYLRWRGGRRWWLMARDRPARVYDRP